MAKGQTTDQLCCAAQGPRVDSIATLPNTKKLPPKHAYFSAPSLYGV